eukprot:INCI4461.1.p1 GENE.INCI4461.1~~INCI4461.1.p1  ORF type:complete len:312 (-),score=66.62 INCI4461.1:149-1084(-)
MSGITADAIAEALAAQQDVSASDPKAVIAFTLKYLREQEDGGADAEGSEADQRRYGFIGIGTINSAVIRGLLSASAVQLAPNTITVSPRNAQRAAALAEQFPQHVKVASTNQEVIDASDYVFVATPPGNDNTRENFQGLHFREDQVVISIIAGASADVLREVCDCPTIVQAFPLPPAEHHCSTTVQWPAHDGVAEVFARLGTPVVVPDATKATAVASISCIMGDFYARLRAAHEWLVAQGVDPVAASEAVGSYFNTFNHASKESKEGFQHLVAEQTPGGMNEKNIAFLEDQGSYAALKATLDATVKRLRGE